MCPQCHAPASKFVEIKKAEEGACTSKPAIAKRAKELGYDAVHEMAKDEARHGSGFYGLLQRYFGK